MPFFFLRRFTSANVAIREDIKKEKLCAASEPRQNDFVEADQRTGSVATPGRRSFHARTRARPARRRPRLWKLLGRVRRRGEGGGGRGARGERAVGTLVFDFRKQAGKFRRDIRVRRSDYSNANEDSVRDGRAGVPGEELPRSRSPHFRSESFSVPRFILPLARRCAPYER